MVIVVPILLIILAFPVSIDLMFQLPRLETQLVWVSDVHEILPADKLGHSSLAATVINNSTKTVVGLTLVVAGTSCSKKPAWPVLAWGSSDPWLRNTNSHAVLPRKVIDVPIPEDVWKRVAAVAMATCGEERSIDVAVTHVDFADGSQWNLGEAIRKGATFVDSAPR